MSIIRQSTARTILVGPVLDSSGAAKTDEVVGSIKVTKNGTVGAADGSATLTHDHAGKYKLALTANDTDTVGVLEISLNSGTNDMPVARLNVVEEAVFDAIFAASAAGYQVPIWSSAGATVNLSGTTVKTLTDAPSDSSGVTTLLSRIGGAITISGGRVDSNVTYYGGSAGTFTAGRPEVNATHWGGTAVASAVVSANAIQISGDSVAADNLESLMDGTGAAMAVTTLTVTGGITVTQSTTNGHGLSITGNGSGKGASIAGGTTGTGVHIASGDSGGYGLYVGGHYGGLYVNCQTDGYHAVTIDAGGASCNAIRLINGNSTLETIALYPGGDGIKINGGVGYGFNGTIKDLRDLGLDHLVSAAVTGTDVTDNSIIAKMVSKSATADWDSFANTTDALEALRDRGDSAWTTATGFSTHSAADVVSAMGTGTFLTAIPWNIAWDAEVQSECADAITAAGVYTGTPPTAGAIADAVWDEAQSGHTTAGTFGYYVDSRISTAGGGSLTAADVWAYATRILTADTNINYPSAATVASQVRTELTTELGRIDVATSTRLATAGYTAPLDAAGTRTAVGLASANLDSQLGAIVADTNELQTDWANGGRLDLILDARASQTSVDDLPTNSELATALASADDVTLAAIAALSIPSATTIADAVLSRSVSTVEGSAAEHTLCTVILASLESSISGTTWTIKRTDGTTTHATKAVSKTPGDDPIRGVS